jgi:hypothetical protein
MIITIVHSVLHLPALLWGNGVPGRCASDIENSTGAAEIAALYEEVHRASSATAPSWRSALPVPAHAANGQLLQK